MAWVRKLPSGRYQACWRDPAGRTRTQTFRRKADAERFLTTQEADILRGSYHDPALGRETVDAYWSQWREGAASRLRPATLALYDSRWRLYLRPAIGSRRLGSITRGDIEAMASSLTARGVGAPTVGQVLRLSSTLLGAAVSNGLIARNPAAGVAGPRLAHTEMRFLTPEQTAALVAELPPRWRAFALLAAYGGFRFGELAALRVERIDFLRRTVRVEEAIAEVAGRQVRGPTKTGARRSVTLPPTVMEALAAHLARYPADRDGLVFTSETGGPVWRCGFRSRVWLPAVYRAGLAPLRFHDLRHTSVALAIDAGGHPKAIQARAGHTSIKTTLDRYGHLFEGIDAQLADRLESLAARGAAAGLLLAAGDGEPALVRTTTANRL